jgi:hypothetical protein
MSGAGAQSIQIVLLAPKPARSMQVRHMLQHARIKTMRTISMAIDDARI